MKDSALEKIRDFVQEDVGRRGLRTDPGDNLISAFPNDFALACKSIAATTQPVLAIVTGFFIVDANPPSAETDGPLGAVFLARALCPMGIKVIFLTEPFCAGALRAGLRTCTLVDDVAVIILPVEESWEHFASGAWAEIVRGSHERPPVTHLLALERVGPTHTMESVTCQAGCDSCAPAEFEREVRRDQRGRCFTVRGRDVTDYLAPAYRLFEDGKGPQNSRVTIGIGDGGNEIGMGKIPWSVIRRNIPQGSKIACRIATDYLIVAGVSNWGAYGLAAGVRLLRGARGGQELFDPEFERRLLEIMVAEGPLVDGLIGRPAISVDGIEFNRYVEPLRFLGRLQANLGR